MHSAKAGRDHAGHTVANRERDETRHQPETATVLTPLVNLAGAGSSPDSWRLSFALVCPPIIFDKICAAIVPDT